MKKKQALGTVFHFQCVCFIQQKKNLQEENMISKYSVKRPYTVLVAVVLVSAELQGLVGEIDQIIQQLKQDRYIDITGMDRQNIPPDEQENGFHIRY